MSTITITEFLRKPVVRHLSTVAMICLLGYSFIGFVFTFCIFFTAGAGVFLVLSRYRAINTGYRPLLFYMLLRAAWQVAQIWLLKYNQPTGLLENCFSLLEFVLLSRQLVNWLGYAKLRKQYPFIVAGMAALWIAETIIRADWQAPAYIARIMSYLLLAPAAIHLLAKAMLLRHELLKNTPFLVSLAIVIAAPVVVVLDSLMLTGMDRAVLLKEQFLWFQYSLAIVLNILYANAIACIYRKPTSSPY